MTEGGRFVCFIGFRTAANAGGDDRRLTLREEDLLGLVADDACAVRSSRHVSDLEVAVHTPSIVLHQFNFGPAEFLMPPPPAPTRFLHFPPGGFEIATFAGTSSGPTTWATEPESFATSISPSSNALLIYSPSFAYSTR